MRTIYDVIKRPIMTEKSMLAAENGKFTFEVDKKANKTEIKHAVEKIFKVEVVNVNTINTASKTKRVGRHSGETGTTKKAIVELVKGQKIKVFEA